MQCDFDDHWHEECGVFGIYGDPEAAEKTYLGLYALQHRGQESAGIASTDGEAIALKKGLGLVWSVFADPNAMPRLRGMAAIGHNRYSTRGASDIVNAQPICIESRLGMVALAHNGTITNASELRQSLQARGAIFQTTSDSEIVLHLMALETEKPVMANLGVQQTKTQRHGWLSGRIGIIQRRVAPYPVPFGRNRWRRPCRRGKSAGSSEGAPPIHIWHAWCLNTIGMSVRSPSLLRRFDILAFNPHWGVLAAPRFFLRINATWIARCADPRRSRVSDPGPPAWPRLHPRCGSRRKG